MSGMIGYDRLTCEIRVKTKAGHVIKFYGAVGIEIETSFDTLTDTAIVTLPYDNKWIKRDVNGFSRFRLISGNDESFFHIGDEIEIHYGYNFENKLEFEGFITEVEPRTPLRLICEDRSWKLKKNKLHFSTKANVTLKEVSEKLLAGTGVEMHPQTWEQEIVFGKLYCRNISTAKLLDEWKTDYGLVSFIKEGKLLVGRSYFNDSTAYNTSLSGQYEPPAFNTEENIIEEDLTLNQILSDEIAIRGVSMLTSNKSIEVTLVQDPQDPAKLMVAEEVDRSGSKKQREGMEEEWAAKMEQHGIFLENYFIRTQHEFNLSKAQLIEAVKAAFPNHVRKGLDGSFVTFGDLSLKPATTVYFLDPKNFDRNGEYLVKSVTKTFGEGGIRQKVEIPYKIRNLKTNNINLIA